MKRFDTLEALVDDFTLEQVLHDLAEICHEKAAHVREVWQDDALAQVWINRANALTEHANGIDDSNAP